MYVDAVGMNATRIRIWESHSNGAWYFASAYLSRGEKRALKVAGWTYSHRLRGWVH